MSGGNVGAANAKAGTERTALLNKAFIPVDADAGRQFGTSFGISTIYLDGSVITTELHGGKAETAARYFAQAGLSDRIDLRVGDALETLRDVKDDVCWWWRTISTSSPNR